MRSCDIWWHGPDWLVSGNFPEPHPISDTNQESKKGQAILANTIKNTINDRDVIDLTMYSSLYNFFRKIAHMEKLVSRLRKQKKFQVT